MIIMITINVIVKITRNLIIDNMIIKITKGVLSKKLAGVITCLT